MDAALNTVATGGVMAAGSSVVASAALGLSTAALWPMINTQ